MDNLSQGLLLSLMGVGVTFAALGVLILMIYVLQVLFPAAQPPGEASDHSKAPTVDDEAKKERAVAVAAAWWYLQSEHSEKSAELGKLLEKPRGAWWQGRDFPQEP